MTMRVSGMSSAVYKPESSEWKAAQALGQVKSEAGYWTYGGYLDAAVPINHCLESWDGRCLILEERVGWVACPQGAVSQGKLMGRTLFRR